MDLIDSIITNKTKCIFISPHLDDAAFSAGELMIRLSGKVEISAVNVFTSAGEGKNTLSAKAYLKQCGVNDAKELYKTRVSEDAVALSMVNAKIYNLGYVEALWRKKKKINKTNKLLAKHIPEFNHLYPVYRFNAVSGKIGSEDYELIEKLIKKIKLIVGNDKNFKIFAPVGFGKHVDHLLVREACFMAFGKNVIYWSDFPYSLNFNEKNEFIKNQDLEQYHVETSDAKVDLCKAYVSQIDQVIKDKKTLYKPELFYLNKTDIKDAYMEVKTAIDNQLLNDWKILWSKSPLKNYFNSPDWFLAAQETFGYKKIAIICAFEDAKLMGILPLVETDRYGVPVFSSPGGLYSDRSSILMAEKDSDLILKIVEKSAELGSFYLNELDESMAKILLNKSTIHLKVAASSDSPYLDISVDPYAHFNSDNKRRITRKIEKEKENLRSEVYLGNFTSQLTLIKDIESQSSKKAEHKDIFSNPEFIKLNKNLDKENPNSILTFILFYKEEPICYQYGFISNDVYTCSNTAYKMAHRSLFPGKVITFLFIPELIKMGIKTLDFSRGVNSFKKDFTPYSRQQYSILYSSNKISVYKWRLLDYSKHQLEKHHKLFESVRKVKIIIK